MPESTVSPQHSVMQRLRSETRPAHDRIEAVPFSLLMQEGRLPRARFAGQLACWFIIHATLEGALAATSDPQCEQVWKTGMARTDHLRHDLACHGPPDVPVEAAGATVDAVTWLSAMAANEPLSLLGCLYVLEGSKMGGAILRKCLDDAYQCGPEALSYYWASGRSPMPDFKAFKERMEAAITTDAERDQVVAAASDMFDRLTSVLEGLMKGLDATTPEPV